MVLDFLFADKILSLLAVLASHNPNSTILVRAAYDSSKKQSEVLMSMNRNLNLIVQNRGYPDLKNCFYYFAGDASKINNGESNGNYEDVEDNCRSITSRVHFPVTTLYLVSDTHVSVFLSLYKSSKKFEQTFFMKSLVLLQFNFRTSWKTIIF